MSVLENKQDLAAFKRVLDSCKHIAGKSIDWLDQHLFKTKSVYFPFLLWIVGPSAESRGINSDMDIYGFNGYFKHVLENVDSVKIFWSYLDELTRRITEKSNLVSEYDISDDPDFALFKKIIRLSGWKYLKEHLIEFSTFKSATVDFLCIYYMAIYSHQTIVDYASKQKLWPTVLNEDVNHAHILASIMNERLKYDAFAFSRELSDIWIHPLESFTAIQAKTKTGEKREREFEVIEIDNQKKPSLSFSLSPEIQLAQDIPDN